MSGENETLADLLQSSQWRFIKAELLRRIEAQKNALCASIPDSPNTAYAAMIGTNAVIQELQRMAHNPDIYFAPAAQEEE